MNLKNNFTWDKFYNELAWQILKYENKHQEFLTKILKLYDDNNIPKVSLFNNNLTDIDPFTFFGLFNRGINSDKEESYKQYIEKKIKLLEAIAKEFNLKTEVPSNFESIPTLLNNNARYFNFVNNKANKKEIDIMWELFKNSLNYSKDSSLANEKLFKSSFEKAMNILYNKRSKITAGLYWIAPFKFLSLDDSSYDYIYNLKDLKSSLPSRKRGDKYLSAQDYLQIVNVVQDLIAKGITNFKNFKELSYIAYNSTSNKNSSSDNQELGTNVIYYGIPGCGKSYEANSEALRLTKDDNFIIRTTFYPDYTNSDFVGQICPKLESSNIIYSIQPGPFVEALTLAWNNLDKKVCLIIEEINRGNAAAIFGDIFQLLDREEDENKAYSIKNYLITQYLKNNCQNKEINFEKIKMPGNLYLMATMNTSDQNVYTLDTAFKRRWEMKYITNDVTSSKFANEMVPVLNMKWKDFVTKINAKIIEVGSELGINGEDKQIGSYFISQKEWQKINQADDKEKARIFGEKIISYIWEDVAKVDRDVIFDEKYKSYDAVLNAFINNEKVFKIDYDE